MVQEEKKTMEINEKTSVFKLGWPIFIEAFLSILIGNVDTLMLSQYSDSAPVAVGNANQILNLLTLMFNIIAGATGVIVAQYLGAKLIKKISEIYSVAIFANLILSVFISLIIFIFSEPIFGLMQLDETLVPDATIYLKLLGGFIFLQAVFSVFTQILRSNGLTRIGMYISLAINVVNIIGNYCFLYGPLKFLNYGVKGVAISSVVSRLLALILVIIFFHRKIEGEISIKYLRPFPKETLKKMVSIGIPTAGESISYSISQILVMSIVNTMGLVAANTKIYASVISNFSYLYSVSVAQATMIITGHLVGAKKEDAAYKRVLKSLRSSMVISVAIAAVSFCISDITFSFFTKNAEILELGHKIMAVAIVLEIGRTANLVIIQSMRAAGDIKFPTYLGMGSMWFVSVLFSFILGKVFGLGLIGVWIAMAMDECLRGIVVYIRWLQGGWRGKSVVDKKE
ncbi:MAG: MATE family efflux transporter [Lachnospiraceae bacterium]|nr:MATE family efflux transporter [Lachnospiraceae bacterium]